MNDQAVAAERLQLALSDASHGLVERDSLVQLIALTAVAREHVLVIGPPGTAKSEAVRRVSRALGGQYFEYLLGRFTEPSEIFGPIDLKRLRDGEVTTRTDGMLPEAEIAFLDEVFLGSTAILNTLLGILNDRVFRRGRTVVQCPLRVCVGASNALPDDEALAAFSDRFLVRTFVQSIPDTRLEDLLEAGWGVETGTREIRTASVADVDALANQARSADMTQVRLPLADAVRTLRSAGITLSDRRVVKIQRLVAAAGALGGRQTPTDADLWPIIYAVPDAESQTLARTVLRDLLAASENEALPAATEEASLGPAARATRIAQAAANLLETEPTDADERKRWQLRLEGVAREMDAAFDTESLPDDLASLRQRIVDKTQSP